MASLDDDVYKYFYELEYITPKEIANLILGNDPRTKPLTYKAHNYKSVLEQVTYKFWCRTNTNLNSKEVFNWAIEKFPHFNPNIPKHYVLKADGGNFKITGQSAVMVCGSPEKIKQDYVNAMHKIDELENLIIEKDEEIQRLNIIEAKHTKKIMGNATGGEHSKGVKKNYK